MNAWRLVTQGNNTAFWSVGWMHAAPDWPEGSTPVINYYCGNTGHCIFIKVASSEMPVKASDLSSLIYAIHLVRLALSRRH